MATPGINFDIVNVVVAYTVGATPATITLGNSTRVMVRMKDSVETWQAGGKQFATASVTSTSDRGIDIEGGDVAKLAKIPRNVLCTITGDIPDVDNGLDEGCLHVTAVRAKINDSSFGTTARKFATSGASFTCTSVDGVVDPITITSEPA